MDWYQRAANQGYAKAQNKLGEIYEKGKKAESYEKSQDVPQNLDLAIEWYRKAAENGNEQAKESLNRLGK